MVAKQDEESPWQYNPDGKEEVEKLSDDDNLPAQTEDKPSGHSRTVGWEAPEFIAHHHPASWYALLFMATIALAALVLVITRDYVASGTIAVLGIVVALYAKREPRVASYELTNTGLSINKKIYPYKSFKSFSMLRDGDMTSLNFFPLKRFMPLVSAYLTKADEDKVIKALGNHLPYEERQMDSIDRLSRRLRF